MSTETAPSRVQREPGVLGQRVVIGGSAGVGFETAQRAHTEGARVILTGRTRRLRTPLDRLLPRVAAPAPPEHILVDR